MSIAFYLPELETSYKKRPKILYMCSGGVYLQVTGYVAEVDKQTLGDFHELQCYKCAK